jgi:hypothetical protein
MKTFAIVLATVALLALAAQAEVVTVTATGQVYSNAITQPPLNAITVGQIVTMSFTVDSNNYVDGVPGDTRGYEIDQSSFVLAFSSGVEIGLLNPFPAGETPYFTLVDGYPVSDGFFVSTSPLSPGGVPIAQTPLQLDLDLGYSGTTLASLDILAAEGVYDFNGLTRYAFDLWQVVPDNVRLGCDFTQLTIALGGVSSEVSSWSQVKALSR